MWSRVSSLGRVIQSLQVKGVHQFGGAGSLERLSAWGLRFSLQV